jgi:hypothetical protein
MHFSDKATPDYLDVALNARNVNCTQAFVIYTGDSPMYRHALCTPHVKEWEHTLGIEYDQLISTGTYEWVKDLPARCRMIGSKLVCHEKTDGKGTVYQQKVCLIMKGFSQIPGQDYHDTHSAVAKYPTLRTLLALAAREDMELHQIDVVGACLRGGLNGEIYMTPPDGLKIKGKRTGSCD